MDGQSIHLWVNHLPVVGVFWTALLLLIALLRAERTLALIAVGFAALVGVSVIPAYLSGNAADTAVTGMAGIEASRIEPHLASAWRSLILGISTTLGSLASLVILRRGAAPRRPVAAVLVLILTLGAFLLTTARLGGLIHRPELG